MAEPDWNPDTAGRPLAEILREAGIESAARAGRRRRWDDPAETGLRQRRAEAAADTAGPNPGRRAADLAGNGVRRPAPEPSTAAIPGLRPSRTPEVPTAATPTAGAPAQRDRRPDGADRRADGADRRADGADRRADGVDRRADGADRRTADKARPAVERERRLPGRPARTPEAEDFSTGPIPIVRDGEVVPEEETSPRESALAWLRFAGELVIALAAGVGVYFLATVLWEQIPQLAVLLTPLAVTGLVAGVSVWRQRMGREPIGTRLLAVLVFAGALLTVAPAASLLAG